MHHIHSGGPPVNAQPHRLAPEKLKAVCQELEHMLEQGVSYSPFFKPVGITATHGPKNFRGLAAMWKLSSIESLN